MRTAPAEGAETAEPRSSPSSRRMAPTIHRDRRTPSSRLLRCPPSPRCAHRAPSARPPVDRAQPPHQQRPPAHQARSSPPRCGAADVDLPIEDSAPPPCARPRWTHTHPDQRARVRSAWVLDHKSRRSREWAPSSTRWCVCAQGGPSRRSCPPARSAPSHHKRAEQRRQPGADDEGCPAWVPNPTMLWPVKTRFSCRSTGGSASRRRRSRPPSRPRGHEHGGVDLGLPRPAVVVRPVVGRRRGWALRRGDHQRAVGRDPPRELDGGVGQLTRLRRGQLSQPGSWPWPSRSGRRVGPHLQRDGPRDPLRQVGAAHRPRRPGGA